MEEDLVDTIESPGKKTIKGETQKSEKNMVEFG